MRTIVATLATLAALLALAGCGGETSETGPEAADEPATEDATEPAEESPEPAEESRCLPVSAPLKRAIAEGLTVQGGGSLGKAAAVRSEDFEEIWYVSAVIRGPGMGDDPVGTWAANIDPAAKDPGGLLTAADAIARAFSDWGAAAQEGSPATWVRGLENDGAQESRDCLED